MTQIYTPDEELHQLHAHQQAHDRFVTRYYLTGHKPIERKPFAREVESSIANRLRASGYSVSRSNANDHYDLLVNGLRIEVKAAALSDHRYQAALRSNDADVLIICCRAPSPAGDGWGEGATDHYFVMPFDEVRGRTHLKISNADPATYAGRLRIWYEAWNLIDRLVSAGVNHWQPSLF